MNLFKRGDRVELVYTNDEWTRLVTGTKGTVIRDDNNSMGRYIDVAWDDGSTLTMVPGTGDEIKLTEDSPIFHVCDICDAQIHEEGGRWFHTRIDDGSHEARPR